MGIALALICLGYILCCVASYILFKRDWRKNLDFTQKDKKIILRLSLFGPISLFSALTVTVARFREKHKLNDDKINDDKIIAKNYE